MSFSRNWTWRNYVTELQVCMEFMRIMYTSVYSPVHLTSNIQIALQCLPGPFPSLTYYFSTDTFHVYSLWKPLNGYIVQFNVISHLYINIYEYIGFIYSYMCVGMEQATLYLTYDVYMLYLHHTKTTVTGSRLSNFLPMDIHIHN